MGKVKIFCSGCTEHIGIIEFIKKINQYNEYECFSYRSLCKKSTYEVRRRIYKDTDGSLKVKNDIPETDTCPISGKSGRALIEYSKQWVPVFHRRGSYSGYIFSDDIDISPFKSKSDETIKARYWDLIHEYDSDITNEITAGLEGINFITLLAIPEIESWFLYSWDTTVKEYYSDNQLIDAIGLYLKDKVFINYWDKFDEWCSKIALGYYYKISEILMKSFEDIQLLDELVQNDETMPNMIYLGVESIKSRHKNKQIKSYTKKEDGPYILSMLNPSVLEVKSNYLKNKFDLIRGLRD